jgi:hypothetical protein
VDLIDFQSFADGSYKYLLVYQDQGCKFPWLEALTTKSAAAVAWQLVRIFSVLAPPSILHTDNGREFARQANLKGKAVPLNDDFLDEVVREIAQLWPDCKLVHGRARHSPSQGGVERLNQTVQKRLSAWCVQNSSTKWSVGCKVVQWGIATDFSHAVKAVPYQLVFGQEARCAACSCSHTHVVISHPMFAFGRSGTYRELTVDVCDLP